MQWEKQIIKVGNSLAVLIPSELAQYIGLQKGTGIIIQDDEGKHGKFVSFWNSRQKDQEEENR